jgi:hypothetical protein
MNDNFPMRTSAQRLVAIVCSSARESCM